MGTNVDLLGKIAIGIYKRPFSAVEGSGFKKLIQSFWGVGTKYGKNIDLDDLLPKPTTILRNVRKSESRNRRNFI